MTIYLGLMLPLNSNDPPKFGLALK